MSRSETRREPRGRVQRRSGSRLVMLLALGFGSAAQAETPDLGVSPAIGRRPVALALNRAGTRLLVANRDSGTVSVIDARNRRLIRESRVGVRLSDLAPLADSSDWVVLDQARNSLVLLRENDGQLEIVSRQPVNADPVRLAISPDGTCCAVASRWGRTLTLFACEHPRAGEPPSLRPTRSIDLPFSPHDLLFTPGGESIVIADAFGGMLAVADSREGRILRIQSLPVHNIRGLTLTADGRSLLLAHQELNPNARAIQDDVQWGALLTNKVRMVSLDGLLGTQESPSDPPAPPIDLGRFSGDPAAIACDHKGRVLVLLGGVDQLVMGDDVAHLEIRTATGRRPTAFAVDPTESHVFVAETLDDTITLFEIPTGKRLAQIPLGAEREPSLEERGERLFYNARLSRGDG